MGSLVQIAGAILVLAAYSLLQVGLISPSATAYILLNVVGASILAVDAYLEEQWGFLLLEAAWAAIAIWSLMRLVDRDTADDANLSSSRAAARDARPSGCPGFRSKSS